MCFCLSSGNLGWERVTYLLQIRGVALQLEVLSGGGHADLFVHAERHVIVRVGTAKVWQHLSGSPTEE